MKTILTVVLLLMAMMAVKTSNANSQEVCSAKYVSCVDACVGKKAGQDQCIATCQQKNDECAASVYGTTGSPSASTEQSEPSGDAADARDEVPAEKPKKEAKPKSKASSSATAKAPQTRKQEIR